MPSRWPAAGELGPATSPVKGYLQRIFDYAKVTLWPRADVAAGDAGHNSSAHLAEHASRRNAVRGAVAGRLEFISKSAGRQKNGDMTRPRQRFGAVSGAALMFVGSVRLGWCAVLSERGSECAFWIAPISIQNW